jgi:hypothetical protein
VRKQLAEERQAEIPVALLHGRHMTERNERDARRHARLEIVFGQIEHGVVLVLPQIPRVLGSHWQATQTVAGLQRVEDPAGDGLRRDG